MRKLIHVPMIHSAEALSEVPGLVGETMTRRMMDSEDEPTEYWAVVNEAISKMKVRPTRIYLEGHISTVTPNEMQFALEVQRHIPENQALKQLQFNATFEVTEDPEMIINTAAKYRQLGSIYEQLQAYLDKPEDYDEHLMEGIMNSGDELYKEIDLLNLSRDRYIAGRITESLKEGETGILFMGADHDVISELPKDVHVEILDERLNELLEKPMDKTRPEGLAQPFEAKG